MDREQTRSLLKDRLTEYVESITQRSKGRNMYICPLCGSGTGKNGTGAFSIKDGVSWKCFSCNQGGDLFDLIGAVEQLPDHNDQLRRALEIFGDPGAAHNTAYTHTHTHTHTQPQQKAAPVEPAEDYSTFFLQAHDHIGETEYAHSRGLGDAVINRFRLGYVAEWRHPKAPETVAPTPRLIIPTSKESYLARDTRNLVTPVTGGPKEGVDVNTFNDWRRYGKSKVGKTHIFNLQTLKTATMPVFIVEGEIDALSIMEVGGEAVALGSTSMIRGFLEYLKENKPTQPLVIAMDSDEAGRHAAAELEKGLSALDIVYMTDNALSPAPAYKDANDVLKKDRERLTAHVAEIEQQLTDLEQARKAEYLHNSVAGHMQEFINGIRESVDTPCIPTGFSALDQALDGGLYEGLYIVGAISSLGKTTLITQIGDQIAQQGHDVLIISLEMARAEIMAKSISRLTLKTALEEKDKYTTKDAKTARGITAGKRYERYSKKERELIKTAMRAYGKYTNRLYIVEGVGDLGADQIRELIKQHISFTGNTPVLIIDYLQILAPYNERATDKQNTDKAVLELKRISRDYKTPVIGISSFNRDNYGTEAKMQSFKESGAIEYGSDILLGLQFRGAGDKKTFDEKEAKRRDPREVELVILKNRNGRTGDVIGYKYYPMFNYFIEDEGENDYDL